VPAVTLPRLRPRIVVLDDWEQFFERLADWSAVRARADVTIHTAPLAGEALVAAVRDAEVLVLMRDRTRVDDALLEHMPQLRHVIHTGSRNQALDGDALKRRGIGLGTTDWGPSKASTCEQTWALILAAMRRLEEQMTLVRSGAWRPSTSRPAADVLAGERLGVIGLGEIGGRVARVGITFGMDVVAWSPHMTPERAAAHGATAVSLETLLETSRVITLHLVPSAATRHLINSDRLALMRRDALLVNTSRAALVDMAALERALAERRIAAAALDVFDQEPLPAGDPLRKLDNAVLSPHTGFVAERVLERFAEGVVQQLSEWLDQHAEERVANPTKP
jgi:phosphoglycerate dehydrogenase-like enzyme